MFVFKEKIGKNFNETKRRFFNHLARQWRAEMILDLGWLGDELTGVYHKPGFATDMGICDRITPNSNTTILSDVKPGSATGANNGLTLILDAEMFDYGTPTEYVLKLEIFRPNQIFSHIHCFSEILAFMWLYHII